MPRKIDERGFAAMLTQLRSPRGLGLKEHGESYQVTPRTVRNWLARARAEGRRIVKDGDGRYREVPRGEA